MKRDMKRVARTGGIALLFAEALVATACGNADGGGGTGPSEPVSIQPQPIPSDAFAESFVASSLTATTGADGIDLRGLITDGLPADAGFSRVMPIAAFDATTSGAIVTASSDATGAFTLHLSGATLGDRVFLFFPGDVSLASALDVATSDPTRATSPCVSIDNVFAVQAPATSGSEDLSVTFASTCASGALSVDHLSTVGDPAISAFPASFAIPASGQSTAQTLTLSPPDGGAFISYLVLAAGSDRHVVAVRGAAH